MIFTSKSKKDKGGTKITLGKKTPQGYEYKAKVVFGGDLISQVERAIQEREANQMIHQKVGEIKDYAVGFRRKKKNLKYYYEIGKRLLPLGEDLFGKISPGSVYRRIFEELPDILPHVNKKEMAVRHLDFMYKIAYIGQHKKNYLSRASWEQWFEISKYKNLYKKFKLLDRVLRECEVGVAGHGSLSKKIKEIRKKF